MTQTEIMDSLISLDETAKDGDKSRNYRLLQEAGYLNGLGGLTRRGEAMAAAARKR
jgi:hypothetical protein